MAFDPSAVEWEDAELESGFDPGLIEWEPETEEGPYEVVSGPPRTPGRIIPTPEELEREFELLPKTGKKLPVPGMSPLESASFLMEATGQPIVSLPEVRPEQLAFGPAGRAIYKAIPEPITAPIEPYMKAVGEQVKGLEEFPLSPLGISTMGYGAMGPLIQRLIAGLYAGHMATQVPAAARQAGEVSVTGSPEEKARTEVGLLANIGMPAFLGRETVRPTPIPRPRIPRPEEIRPGVPTVPTRPGLPPIVPTELPETLAPAEAPKLPPPVSPAAPEFPTVVIKAPQKLELRPGNIWYGPDGPISEILETSPEKGSSLVRYTKMDPKEAPREVSTGSIYQRPPSPGAQKELTLPTSQKVEKPVLQKIEEKAAETEPVEVTNARRVVTEYEEMVAQEDKIGLIFQKAARGEELTPEESRIYEQEAGRGEEVGIEERIGAEREGYLRAKEIVDAYDQETSYAARISQMNKDVGLSSEVEVADSLPEGDPFARHFDKAIATIRGNKIIINRARFREWIRKIPPKHREAAIRSLGTEEGIHIKIKEALGDALMKQLWNDLTPVERAAMRKSYTGQWREVTDPKDPRYVGPAGFGHEYMRRVMQWAMRTDVREVAEVRGRTGAWITEAGIDLGLRAVDKIRRTVGTQTAKNIGWMLDRVQANLEGLQQARGITPKALVKEEPLEDRARKMLTMPVEQLKSYPGGATGLAWDIGRTARTPEDVAVLKSVAEEGRDQIDQLKKSGKIMEAVTLAGRQPAEAYEYATGVKLDGTPKWNTLERLIPDYRPPVPDPKYLQAKGIEPEAFVAARRKPTPEERGIQPTFLLPPRSPEEARPTALESGAFVEAPSMQKAIDAARTYLENPEAFFPKKKKKAIKAKPAPPPLKEGEFPPAKIVPLRRPQAAAEAIPEFSRFAKEMQRRYPGQNLGPVLQEAWEESVWDYLMRAPGKKLERLRDLTDLRESLTERQIVDAPVRREGFALERELEKEQVPEEKKILKATQEEVNRRLHAIAAIGQKLIEGSKPEARKDVGRPKVFTADLGFNLEKKGREPAWVEFNPEDSKQKGFGLRLTSGGRMEGQPESVTRRITAVRDNMTGEVHMLSTYRTGEGFLQIYDPQTASLRRPHVPLGTLLGRKFGTRPRYTVLASAMVSDPVQNFHQRFRSELEWREQFADTAFKEAENLKQSAAEAAALAEKRAAEKLGLEEEAIEEVPAEERTAEELASEAAGVSTEVPAEPERPALKTGQPLTDAEAGSLFQLFSEEFGGKVESLDDIRQQFEELIVKPGRELTPADILDANALDKMWRTFRSENPQATPEEAMSQVFNWIYENTRQGQTREIFTAEALRRFAPARGAMVAPSPEFEWVRPTLQRRTRAAEEAARQVAEQRARYATERMNFDDWFRRYGPFSGRQPAEVPGRAPMAPAFRPGRPGTRIQPPELARPGVSTAMVEAVKGEGIPGAPEPRALTKRDTFRSLATLADDLIRNPLRAYSEWMVDRLRRVGGPVTQIAANSFNGIIDREKQLYGELTPVLDPARREAGKLSAATTWMHKLEPITDRTAVANVVGAIEGSRPVPPFARNLADVANQANLVIGQLYQSVVEGFTATGKFQRNLTALGYDVIRQGRGRMWNDWTRGLSQANAIPLYNVQQFFRRWKTILDEPGASVNVIEQVNQDFARRFPETVTHVKVGDLAPQWQQVIHSDLYTYLETAARRASHIRAFREAYPNNQMGRRMFGAMQRGVRRELAPTDQKAFDALMRTLQGHPTDNYSKLGFLAPGTTGAEAFRFLNSTLGNLFARMVLTGQMVTQQAETIIGSTPQFFGYRNTLEAMSRSYQLYSELERAGAVNRAMYDFSFDPSSKVRSTFRILSNILSKTFAEQWLNEVQESFAAATARVVTERIQGGILSNWERRMLPQTFKAMGFNPSEVSGLMRGDVRLLGQFQRKAANFLTSGNKAISEGSILGANRLFNSIFRFNSYPMMKTNQLRRVTGNLFEAWGKGTASDKRAATEQFARWVVGTGLQGALTVATAAVFYEGLTGLKIRAAEATDEPFQFIVESILSSISGPLYLVWRGARNKGVGGVGEQTLRTVFPYSIAADVWDAAHGQGQYRDLDTFEKLGRFLQQKLPGSRPVRLGFATFGLSQKNLKLDASIRAFYRWRRDALGFTEKREFLEEDERAAFRRHMKKAVEALQEGRFEDYFGSIADAAGEARNKPRQEIAQSLKARRILKTPAGKDLNPDQIEDLRKRIGSDAVDRLQYFDLMLNEAAEGIILPGYD